MKTTLRILSALLCYPDAVIKAAAPSFQHLLMADGALCASQIALLEPLIDHLVTNDLIEAQERYVGLFDRGRSVSLHLFEHVHGESRDRGQAMVDLKTRYERHGLEIDARELPDYLPMFLEYLSQLPHQQAQDELAETGLIVAALAERLAERDSLYAAPMVILRDLSGVEEVAALAAAQSLSPPEDPDDLEALDAAWAEEQIRFDTPIASGSDSGCPQAAAMVARFADPSAMPKRPTSSRNAHHV